jgi:hypothetical protein
MAEMLFSNEKIPEFLNLGGIRFIVLDDDDNINQDNAFYWYGNRIKYKELLEKYLSYLPKKSI